MLTSQCIGYILAELQVLMIALDVQNTRNDTNIEMTWFWLIITMSVLFYICTFLPFGVFYSEINEEKDFVSGGQLYRVEMAYVRGNEAGSHPLDFRLRTALPGIRIRKDSLHPHHSEYLHCDPDRCFLA
jgi:hypothetical protein